MASLFNPTQCALETMHRRLFSLHSEVTVEASIIHNKCSPQNTERKGCKQFSCSKLQATTVPPFTVARENIHTPRLVFVKRDVYVVQFCPVRLSTLTGFQPRVPERRSAIV